MVGILYCDDHVLLIIFEKCSISSLESLYFVCERFQSIIEKYLLTKRCLNLLMSHGNPVSVSNQRTHNDLSNYRRLRISQNWCQGRYAEHTFYRHQMMYASYLHLERDTLYMSHRGELRTYRRLRRGLLETVPQKIVGQADESDITCFTKRGDSIFGGRTLGTVWLHENNELIESHTAIASCAINAVDLQVGNGVLISASRKELVLWQRQYELDMISLEPFTDIQEEYKSIQIDPSGKMLAAGKYIDRTKNALELVDLTTITRRPLGSKTHSIYDMLWRDENTILTAHYDSSMRLFDMRTNCDEYSWLDPYDSSVFTLDYDGMYGVVCGMNYHSRVNLYDLRKPNAFVQMFYPAMDGRNRGSPVYALVCDASQMFLATDHNLRVFDFNTDWATQRDYFNIFL